jgi:hypothetical protein
MKRLSIFIFGVFGLGLAAILFSNNPSVSTEDQKLFQQQVLGSIGTLPAEWDSGVRPWRDSKGRRDEN